jgi:hypothetical protein
MTVSCPQCGTRYRAPGGVGAGAQATYRCSRCRLVFSARAGRSEPRALLPQADASASLEHVPEIGAELDPLHEPLPPGAGRADPPAFVRPETAFVGTGRDLPPEPAFAVSAVPPELTEVDTMPEPRTFSSLRLGIRFQAFVLVAFGALSLYLTTHPTETLGVIKRIPLVGQSFLSDGALVDTLHIVDARGSHERLKGGRPAFVIAGKVVNNADEPLGAIQVEARLYTQAGEAARKVVFAGSQASLRIVRSWTPAEIAIFEKIKPPKTYKLSPGDAADFLVVFQERLEGLSTFTCQVVAALPAGGR